ncbi:uncharacterized protein LOC133197651 [Saccostrea echinata]|uniref:uncharacterized protein LOC133197651 n=1 Tax=Saccostrea echinata TaxID=191078 RepID=UPI002A80BB78|nr:uncharacterized protein LOC133197651 [Saccostrea echinata]
MLQSCLTDLLTTLRDNVMFKSFEILAVSLTVNCCILCYCLFTRIQRRLSSKCCCEKCGTIVAVCQTYNSKPHYLPKVLTEQLFMWIVVILSFGALCGSDVIRYPFSKNPSSTVNDLVGILLAINIGRYIYLISVNIYLYGESEPSRIKTDTMHHVVTVVCYSVFLAYHQNLLLSLVGMTMETNSTVIELSKILKELGKNRTKLYSKLSFLNCALTLVFRGIVPVVFLVIAMFHETPFVMHYTTLTVFFLSIIFFSVINVWLILATIQRLVRSFCKTTNEFENTENVHGIQRVCQSHLTTRNNLGYLRRYDNKNLCTVDDEKLNTNRKEMTKENIPHLNFLRNGMHEFIPQQTIQSDSENYVASSNVTLRTVDSIPLQEIVVERSVGNNMRDSNSSETSAVALIGDTGEQGHVQRTTP